MSVSYNTTLEQRELQEQKHQEKVMKQQMAQKTYGRICDQSGNLINDPFLHIIIAILNIDVKNELVER